MYDKVLSADEIQRLLAAIDVDFLAGTRDLAITYTAPYLRIGALRFRYQLEGYDKEWIYTDASS